MDVDIEEVKDIVGRALSAPNKAAAKPHIQKLGSILSNANLYAETRLNPDATAVFRDLLSYVETGSGNVRNKAHWVSCAEQKLYLLECFLK